MFSIFQPRLTILVIISLFLSQAQPVLSQCCRPPQIWSYSLGTVHLNQRGMGIAGFKLKDSIPDCIERFIETNSPDEVLDSFYCNEYFLESGIWVNRYQGHKVYNDDHRLDSFWIQEFDLATDSWKHVQRNILEYDDEGLLEAERIELYDAETQEWFTYYAFLFDYDENGVRTSGTYKYWNIASMEPRNLARDTVVYDQLGEVSEQTFFKWSSVDGWINDYRYLHSTEGDTIRDKVRQKWSASHNNWYNDHRTRDIYRNGQHAERLGSAWSWIEYDRWSKDWRGTLEYKAGKLVGYAIWRWGFQAPIWSWTPSHQHVFSYDQDGRLEGIQEEAFEVTSFDWENDRRTMSAYNDNDSLISEITQYWSTDSKAWSNHSKDSIEYDTQGRITYQGGFEFEPDAETWILRSLITMKYDTFGNLIEHMDSSRTWYGVRKLYTYTATHRLSTELTQLTNSDNLQWTNLSRKFHTYDQLDSLIEVVTERWEDSIWVNHSYDQFTYDSTGNLILETLYSWDSIFWVPERRTRVELSELGQIVTEVNQSWSIADSIWVNNDMNTYGYDANGNVNLEVWSYWDEGENRWVNNRKAETTYDGLGRAVHNLEYHWDEMWVFSSEEIWEFDHMGNQTKYLSRSSNYGSGESHVFDEDGRLIESVRLSWSPQLSTWLNKDRDLYIRDENGATIESRHYHWFNQWTLFETTYYERDDMGNILLQRKRKYSDDTHSFSDAEQELSTYSPTGTLVERIRQLGKISVTGWTEASHCQYVWENTVATNEPRQENNVYCLYANPFDQAWHTITCMSSDPRTKYSLRLYDMSGQVVYTAWISTGMSVKVNNDLTSGVYVLTLSDDSRLVYSGKLVVLDP